MAALRGRRLAIQCPGLLVCMVRHSPAEGAVLPNNFELSVADKLPIIWIRVFPTLFVPVPYMHHDKRE
jgi:hypothetical protein